MIGMIFIWTITVKDHLNLNESIVAGGHLPLDGYL